MIDLYSEYLRSKSKEIYLDRLDGIRFHNQTINLLNDYMSFGYDNLKDACEKVYWILGSWNNIDSPSNKGLSREVYGSTITQLLSYDEFLASQRDDKLNTLINND